MSNELESDRAMVMNLEALGSMVAPAIPPWLVRSGVHSDLFFSRTLVTKSAFKRAIAPV